MTSSVSRWTGCRAWLLCLSLVFSGSALGNDSPALTFSPVFETVGDNDPRLQLVRDLQT